MEKNDNDDIVITDEDSNEINIVLIIMIQFVTAVCQIKNQGIVVKTMAGQSLQHHITTQSDLKPNNYIRGGLSMDCFRDDDF